MRHFTATCLRIASFGPSSWKSVARLNASIEPADRTAVADIARSGPLIGEIAREPVPIAAGPDAESLRRGAFLMACSLMLLVAANALGRQLAVRYPIGEVIFFRFCGARPFVILSSASAGLRISFLTRRRGSHALRAILVMAATGALYASSRHLPFGDLIAIAQG